jgi:hypothetical protein
MWQSKVPRSTGIGAMAEVRLGAAEAGKAYFRRLCENHGRNRARAELTSLQLAALRRTD